MHDTSEPVDGQARSFARLIERLHDPACYPHPTTGIRVIETHISWVFLTGPFAYKLKKPRNLGFLDYTTLDRRRWCCEEEVRVSGRFAPALYVAAVPITGTADSPRVAGGGPAIEWAVKLVQFDDDDRLDRRFQAGLLTVEDCQRLAAAIAAVASGLAVATPDQPWGTADSIAGAVELNLDQIRAARPDLVVRVDRVAGWLAGRLSALGPVIESRRAAGRVRECHGDLHLGNLLLHEGRMTAFDAIEFNPSLRWVDVANDVAFLVMDLEARGRTDLAAHVRSAWMETADDHASAVVFPLFEVYRAVVRSAVAALRPEGRSGSREETERYLELAERLIRPRPPRLVATCGVAGSGKSTLAGGVVGAIGAVRIRSDVERKRLAGLPTTARPGDAAAESRLYGDAMTRQVYERLARLAATVLDAGSSVVVDAACNRRWQRELLSAVARDRGVPLTWLELDLPEATILSRVAARQAADHDASDASPAVVHRQRMEREPIAADEVAEPGCTLVRITEPIRSEDEFLHACLR